MEPEGIYLMQLIIFIIGFGLGYMVGIYDGWRTCKRMMQGVVDKIKELRARHS